MSNQLDITDFSFMKLSVLLLILVGVLAKWQKAIFSMSSVLVVRKLAQ